MSFKRPAPQGTCKRPLAAAQTTRAASDSGGRAFGKDLTNLLLLAPTAPSARASAPPQKLQRLVGKRRLCSRVVAAKSHAPEARVDAANREKPEQASAFHHEIVQYLASIEVLPADQPSFRPKLPRSCPERAPVVDWVFKVCRDFKLKDLTALLTVNLFDRAASVLPRVEKRLLGVACLRVASKYEEIYINQMADLIKATSSAFSREDILQAELAVLAALKFEISQPCHFTVVERARVLLRLEPHAPFAHTAVYLLKLAQLDPSLAQANQHLLAVAAAAFVAQRVFGKKVSAQVFAQLCAPADSAWGLAVRFAGLALESRSQPLNPVRRAFLGQVGPQSCSQLEPLLCGSAAAN